MQDKVPVVIPITKVAHFCQSLKSNDASVTYTLVSYEVATFK